MPTIVESAKGENNGSKPVQAHSNITPNYDLAGTYKFGLNQICGVVDTVPNDTVRLTTGHELRSMNLEAPLMGDIRITKNWFEIPLSAILPLNEDKLMKKPLKGEDIDADEVGTTITGLYTKLWSKVQMLWNYYGEQLAELPDPTEEDWTSENWTAWTTAVGNMFLSTSAFEKIFSKGSLSAALGKNIGSMTRYIPDEDSNLNTMLENSDEIIEKIYTQLFTDLENLQDQLTEENRYLMVTIDKSDHYKWKVGGKDNDRIYLSNRQFLEKVKDASALSIYINPNLELGSYASNAYNVGLEIGNNMQDMAEYVNLSEDADDQEKKPINIKNEISYQLCNAEFFTNSHIDYVYSAELYRQNVASLLYSTDEGMGLTRDMFSWNGTDYYYDILSAHSLNKGLYLYSPADVDYTLWYDLVNAIFGYRRSLRYKDYYTGGRSNPLAVGDIGIQVNDGYVSVVDTIQKTWAARFLNQVNRVGNKSVDYFKGMFPGLVMHRDFHEPIWLAKTTDSIFTEETANTGTAQMEEENSTNAVLRSTGNNWCFEFKAEKYGTIIGIVSFEIKRYYGDVIERPNFWVNRDDYFNPFLQFVGDQKIYSDELNARFGHNRIFGYAGRYKEYRDRVDQCFGGLSNGRLKGWLFDAPDYEDKLTHSYISPDYIRSRPSELDQYYSKLTGYAEGNYFHFIIINRNTFDMDREMVADPQIW